MRLHPGLALLVCLCLWIPVAQSDDEMDPPEDQDDSGDEGFSGSGSGDSDFINFINNLDLKTEGSSNNTNGTWLPDGSLEDSVTQPPSTLPPDADPEISDPTNQDTGVHTTQTLETQPTSTTVIPFEFGEDLEEDESTTIHGEDQTETTTSALPVVPLGMETTTTAFFEEDTTVSDLKEKDETTTLDVMAFKALDETTPVPLSTTSAVEPADPEASGDSGESTTTQAMFNGSFIEDNIIPEVHNKEEKGKLDEDFLFEDNDDHKPKTRAGTPESEFKVGASSDESLLERKEVLAGVIAGGVVGLAFAIMLVGLMVYRMKKKDEGSYALDEHKHPSGGYQKAQRQEEFLA